MRAESLGMLLSIAVVLFPGLGRAELPQDAAANAAPGAGVLAAPLGTAFTYQGQLSKSGSPVNTPCDFRFSLWDAETAGNQIGNTQPVDGVSVTNGQFMAEVNVGGEFDTAAFNGEARWLEIAVRNPAGSGDYTTLSRQKLTAAPYALALPGLWTQQTAGPPNIVGGYRGNLAGANVQGAVIAGGGHSTPGDFNRVWLTGARSAAAWVKPWAARTKTPTTRSMPRLAAAVATMPVRSMRRFQEAGRT